jgi:hypothetical protein
MSKEVSLQEAFDRASDAITKGQPQAAVQLLEKIRETRHTSSDLEGNLALAYAQGGDFAKASEHYAYAVALDRSNSSLRNDLALAQSKVSSGMGSAMSHPSEWAWKIASYARPNEILGVASFLLLGLLALKYLRKPMSRLQNVIAFGSVLLIASLGLFARSSASIALCQGETVLRSGPLESSEQLMNLLPGTRLRIIRESPPFLEVERPNAFRGWVDGSKIARLGF